MSSVGNVSGNFNTPEPIKNNGENNNAGDKKVSVFDYDGDGVITQDEQKKALGEFVTTFMNSTFKENWAETFRYAQTTLTSLFSKYVKGDISAKNEQEIKNAENQIAEAKIALKEDMVNTMKKALDNKSVVRVKETVEDIKELCDEYNKYKSSMDENLKKEYKEVAEKRKHLLDVEIKMHKFQNKTDLVEQLEGAVNMLNITFGRKTHVLGQYDPKDVEEGDYAVAGDDTYQYKNGKWVKINTNP